MVRLSMRALVVLLGGWLALLPAPAASAEALAGALQTPVVSCGAARIDRQRLVPYYDAEDPAPLWVTERGPSARAGLLRAALQNAEQEGLTPERYRLAQIEAHWPATSAAEQACLELLLTAAFDRYSRDLRRGRVDPREADPAWMPRPPDFDPVAALQAAVSDDELARLLDALPPAHDAYRRLRVALAEYRRLAAEGGWPVLPPGPALAPGDAHEHVPALRARLRAEGDLPRLALSFGLGYDVALVEAVQRYQRRHGLAPDGIVGARTRAALNVPAAERAARLRRAMERLRWLPRDLGAHYILANTAGFELKVIEDRRTVLAMRTVTGMPAQATPSFTATLESLIVNPYWYVPQRIARERFWPQERRAPGHLAALGFQIFDTRDGGWREIDPATVDWPRIDGDDPGLRLRQAPGPKNALGRLLFVPPNLFDVFLHDTPQRALFERDLRALSEGCVRLENARALALHLLRHDPAWTEARLNEDIDALRHITIALPEPVPVHVLYLPSWVDEGGRVHFRDDVYRREAVLARYYPAE